MKAAYLVTDVANSRIIAEYPQTVDGFAQAATYAAIYAQIPQLYTDGISLDRRNDDLTITEIVRITSSK